MSFSKWLGLLKNIIPAIMMGLAACHDVEPGYMVIFHHPNMTIDAEKIGSNEEPFWIKAVRNGVPVSTKLGINSQKITAVAVDPESDGALETTIDAMAKNGYGSLWFWRTLYIKM